LAPGPGRPAPLPCDNPRLPQVRGECHNRAVLCKIKGLRAPGRLPGASPAGAETPAAPVSQAPCRPATAGVAAQPHRAPTAAPRRRAWNSQPGAGRWPARTSVPSAAQRRTVSWDTASPRSAGRSSTSRWLSVKRRSSRAACWMTTGGNWRQAQEMGGIPGGYGHGPSAAIGSRDEAFSCPDPQSGALARMP
jgi:hypothetical protein